jgi:hypothetical protein
VTAPAPAPQALEECVAQLDDLLVRLSWIHASLHRLRGDLDLTESRLRYAVQGIQDARDDGRRALQNWQESR